MGEKSDSKKGSSPYVVLENRPLDQWKVTELKEELKKRKLLTKGLKEDLVKRLDEAVRAEMDEARRNIENDLNSEAKPEVQSDDATGLPAIPQKNVNVIDDSMGENEGLEKDEELDNEKHDNRDVQMGVDMVHAHDGLHSAGKMAAEDEGGLSTQVESFQVVQDIQVETMVLASDGTVSEKFSRQELEMVGNQNKDELLDQQPRNRESKPESQSPEGEQTKPSFSNMDLDGSKSESVEVGEQLNDNAPAQEKDANNDVCKENDRVIVDDVESELDIRLEKVEPLSVNMVLDGDKSESIEVVEPLEDNTIVVETYAKNDESVNVCKKNDSGDMGSSEKLNLDRSSGDDSMEEDALESKQIDSKFNCEDVVDNDGKIEVPSVKEDDSVHSMVEDVTADKNATPIEDKTGPSVTSTKRKPHDQEVAQNSEVVKRQRRWNSEGLKVPEQQATNLSASTTPKNASQTPLKRTFSRNESTVSQELPKERVVPPSSKPPTTSLRIDNFLRPFTLKAVQELLGKTGTVVSFWMDHIKTHCYVTYASVEEAIETRNALCNLQWPVNGGRLLMADFVDPQEVKNKVNPPLPSPATPVVNTLPPATTQPPQPSPRLQVQKQQLPPPPPPPSLPPPPPLSNPPPPARERAAPPPPPPKKGDPPIVTLDDLFRKTRATPRIYYLPLSEEEVAAKLKKNAQGKSEMQ